MLTKLTQFLGPRTFSRCRKAKTLYSTLRSTSVSKQKNGFAVGESFLKSQRSVFPFSYIRNIHVCAIKQNSYKPESTETLKKMASPEIEALCTDLIRNNTVMIFSKSSCPFCTKVKDLFTTQKIPFGIVELDSDQNGADIQQYLHELTKQKTVPYVFVKGRHIGGCDSTFAAHYDGSLHQMIQYSPIQFKVENLIKQNHVMVFSKTTCPFCVRVKELFVSLGIKPGVFECDLEEDGTDVQNYLYEKTKQKTVPNVFVRGVHVGGSDDTMAAHQNGRLMQLLKGEGDTETARHEYNYDIIVIGGGSGGLAAAKEASQLGKSVALCDFVVPTPIGTTWGLGGTCVNVGCIPKKLMHQAALHGEHYHDSKSFGWGRESDERDHSWETMVENVQNYIKSLNFGYRKELNKRKVKYYNAYAEFVTPHKVKLTKKNGEVEEITGNEFIIAVGGRPHYPDIPGAREYGISSDDIFSLPKNPGKTLVVGASYIALECAGFLRGLGNDVTVMVRSILLRGFDRQMAELVGEHMDRIGIKFIKETVPKSIDKDELGKLTVVGTSAEGDLEFSGYDTVLFAVGREACTGKLGLENVPLRLNPKNHKVIADEFERTSVPHIYAIGDVIDGKPELTPVAIHAGRYLAKRISGVSNEITNYKHVPTTVFTPLEYGCVGLSEEEAYEIFGKSNIIVYHNAFKPLEHALSRDDTVGYAKLICVKSLNELVVGFHILSPNAGEITQGFAIGLKLGAKKRDFDDLIGIHPTCAEVFTTLVIVKNPGDKPPETTGC